MEMPIIKEKDTICVVAPAGMLRYEDLELPIQLLEGLGYPIELGKHLFHKYFYGYNYSGSVQERTEDLQWALDHPTAKAIWFARGGYGGVQIVDDLNLDSFHKNPKWCIGYSDNTIFHQLLNKNNIPTIHGTTLKPLGKNLHEVSFYSVLEILKGDSVLFNLVPHKHNQNGNIKAPITGGNLSILYSLTGSKTMDQLKGKILFIEDWHENWYHLDRMLRGMERAGVFEGIRGLLVGSFTKMDNNTENYDYLSPFDTYSYQIIADIFESYNIPKAFGFSAGHIEANLAFPIGKIASLSVDSKEVSLQF